MATINLAHRHIFGHKNDVQMAVAHIDDQAVVYAAGHLVVVYHIDEQRQKFLPCSESTDGISALAFSENKRFLAVAEVSNRALISIIDLKTLKKRKVFSIGDDFQGKTIVSMAFSPDSQHLLAQCGGPDWTLTYWNWGKGKCVASVVSPLNVPSYGHSSTTSTHQLSSYSGMGATFRHLPSSSAAVATGGQSSMGASDGVSATNSGTTSPTLLATCCSFCGDDPSLICVTGPSLVRFFRIADSTLRPLPSTRLDESSNVLCHTWLKQRDHALIAGTSMGDLLLFNEGEFITRLPASPGKENGVHSIIATSKGVVCGLADSTIILYGVNLSCRLTKPSEDSTDSVHTSSGPSEVLYFQRSIQLEADPYPITTLSVNLSEKQIVASLASNQLVKFTYEAQPGALGGGISSALSNVVSSVPSVTEAKDETQTVADSTSPATLAPVAIVPKADDINNLLTAFHRPGESHGLPYVTGLDTCVRKPMLVTCGLDRSVRIWNYLEHTCELTKTFGEEVYSVACHPSGLHILAGFADKLRLMNVLMEDLRVVKEFSVKACRECQFATGGHLFAAVNGNTIQVFTLLTGELLTTLRGHNGKVRSLHWNADDSGLLSAGMDGAVYLWDLDESKRDAEFVQKGVPYYSAVLTRDGSTVYAVGQDRLLKELEFPTSQLVHELTSDVVVGQIALAHSQRLLFAATSEPDKPGRLRVYRLPIYGSADGVENAVSNASEFQALSKPITRLRVSYDDKYLFCSGEDGCIAIFEIRDKEAGRAQAGRGGALATGLQAVGGYLSSTGGGSSGGGFSEEVLVTRSDLEEKQTVTQELKTKVDELMLQNEYQLRLKDMTYNEALKDLTERFTHEIDQEKNKFELLREDKNDLEMEYEEQLKQLEEKHVHALQALEADAQHRIMTEVEKYQEALAQRDAQRAHWEKERARLQATHERYVSEVTDDFEQRLSEEHQLRVQMEEENDELDREYAETVAQIEADVDEEIENLKKKYEAKLQAEREATLRFKGENGIMKKKFSALQKDIEDQRDTIKTLLEKEKALIEQIKSLEKEIQALKREIRSRDETIGEKEKRIYDLKKKNQELEKFKFVLDYKIKELKRQIEPRETEISDMKTQIRDMDKELELFHKSNAQLDALIGEQRQRLDAMGAELAAHRCTIGKQCSWRRRFRCDLYDCVQHIQDPEALRLQVAELYQRYASKAQTAKAVESDIQQEYSRQKEYLETAVKELKKQYAHENTGHQEEHLRATASNMVLIQEINELRSLITSSRATLQMERAAMQTRARENQMQQNNSPKHREQEDLDDVIRRQQKEIDSLQKQIQAIEERMLTPTKETEGMFPPIRGIDG